MLKAPATVIDSRSDARMWDSVLHDGAERSISVDSFSDLTRMTRHTRFMSLASSTAGDPSSLGIPWLTAAEGS